MQVHDPDLSLTLNSQIQYVRIETIGRKSGKAHQALLRFVTIGEKIIVFPLNAGRQDWLSNLKANPKVKMYTEGGIFAGIARLRRIANANDPVVVIFTRKYGKRVVSERYRGQRLYVELQVTKVETGGLDQIIYDDLEVAFDGVARHYDQHILGNPINTWLRNVSVSMLERLFKPGDVVLEVGCGTGTETLSLARRGITILASDISGRMLEVLERKARQEGVQDRVITLHCRAGELVGKINALGYDKIDGAYSTYGAINTEPRLDDLFRDLHSLLKREGLIVLGVWNKYSLYEILGYLLRGKPGLAFARFRNPVPIGRSRFCVASNAYSVESLDAHLGRFFKLRSIIGVVILLPPSNLTRYLPRGRWLGFLKRLDLRLGKAFPFNRLGDHFLAVYVARGDLRG